MLYLSSFLVASSLTHPFDEFAMVSTNQLGSLSLSETFHWESLWTGLGLTDQVHCLLHSTPLATCCSDTWPLRLLITNVVPLEPIFTMSMRHTDHHLKLHGSSCSRNSLTWELLPGATLSLLAFLCTVKKRNFQTSSPLLKSHAGKDSKDLSKHLGPILWHNPTLISKAPDARCCHATHPKM